MKRDSLDISNGAHVEVAPRGLSGSKLDIEMATKIEWLGSLMYLLDGWIVTNKDQLPNKQVLSGVSGCWWSFYSIVPFFYFLYFLYGVVTRFRPELELAHFRLGDRAQREVILLSHPTN